MAPLCNQYTIYEIVKGDYTNRISISADDSNNPCSWVSLYNRVNAECEIPPLEFKGECVHVYYTMKLKQNIKYKI